MPYHQMQSDEKAAILADEGLYEACMDFLSYAEDLLCPHVESMERARFKPEEAISELKGLLAHSPIKRYPGIKKALEGDFRELANLLGSAPIDRAKANEIFHQVLNNYEFLRNGSAAT